MIEHFFFHETEVIIAISFAKPQGDFRGRTFDSEGGGGWHFLEINILTSKMLKIKNMSSSEKKISNLTLTFL